MRHALHTMARVLLGSFILWQLFFLPASNFLGMWRRLRPFREEHQGKGPPARSIDRIAGWTECWGELTGQPQNWSLFAPEVGRHATFVAVMFRWDDDPQSAAGIAPAVAPLSAGSNLEGALLLVAATRILSEPPAQAPILLPSENEPPDLGRYFRVGKSRLRCYEDDLAVDLSVRPGRTEEDESIYWQEDIKNKVRGSWRQLYAYLRWKLCTFRQAHPQLASPRQVILIVRTYEVPPPQKRPWFWSGPVQRPLARWQPLAAWDPGYLPVEVFNPVFDSFESLPEKGP